MKTPIPNNQWNILSHFTQKPDPREYNESWYIYKIGTNTNNPDSEYKPGMLEGDFVTQIFGGLSTGVNVANIFWTPATEFTDNVGNAGKISIKNLGFSPTADPDVASFFPKFLWKGFLNAFSNKYFTKDKTLYVMYKEIPETDNTGKITNASAYLVFAHQDKQNKGKFIQTRLTLSFLDSNMAKNNADQYVQFEMYLRPVVPSNAKYLRVTPTTPSFIDPTNVQVLNENNTPINGIPVFPEGYSVDNWRLERIRFNIQGDTINIVSPFIAEYNYQNAKKNNTRITQIGFGVNHAKIMVVLGLENFYDKKPYNDNYLYFGITIAIHQNITISTLWEQYFIDYLSKSYKMGGPDSLATSFPTEYYWDIEGSIAPGILTNNILRTTANWKRSNRYFYADNYDNYWRIDLAIGVGEMVWIGKPFYNPVYDRKKLFTDIVGYGLAIPGGSPTKQMLKTMKHNAEPNIEDIVDNNGWGFVNDGGPIQEFVDAYKPVTPLTKNIMIHKVQTGKDTYANIVNAEATYPLGGMVYKEGYFTNLYQDREKYKKDRILYQVHPNKGGQINQVSQRRISGNFINEWLDEDMNLCVGINIDGELIEIAEQEVKSPQALFPTNTEFKVVYVGT